MSFFIKHFVMTVCDLRFNVKSWEFHLSIPHFEAAMVVSVLSGFGPSRFGPELFCLGSLRPRRFEPVSFQSLN